MSAQEEDPIEDPIEELPVVGVWQGLMTPEMAQNFLDHNFANRSISEKNITNLMHALRHKDENGNPLWRLTGNAISLDVDGNLVDGQHRCIAVVRTGIPARVVIVRNIEREAQMVMDTGRKRSFADWLSMNGVPNKYVLANLVKLVYNLESHVFPLIGTRANQPEPPTPDLWARYLQDPDTFQEAAKIGETIRRSSGGISSAVSALWYFLHTKNDGDETLPSDIEDFFEKFKTGADISTKHPIFALRRILDLRNDSRPRINYIQYALMVKAWNAYRDGKEVTLLRWSPGGKNPERMPVPH